MRQFREVFMKIVFLISACASILAILLICVFLFSNGIPAMAEIGFGDFLLGTTWKPLNDMYGIFPMIVGSLYVTAARDYRGGSDRSAVCGFHGPFLSEKTLRYSEACCRSDGRNSFYCIRLFRYSSLSCRSFRICSEEAEKVF